MNNYDNDWKKTVLAPEPEEDEDEERLAQIGLLITDLRGAGSLYALDIRHTEDMARQWLAPLDGVPDDELASRDVGSIYDELTRRKKYAAGDVAELWAARQGNAERAWLERTRAQKREDRFAGPQSTGPGNAALMAIGAALGYRAEAAS